MGTTIEKLIESIADLTQNDKASIKFDTKIFSGLNLESVEMLELEYILEEEFNVTMDDNDLWKLPSYLVNNGLFEQGKILDDGITLVKEKLPNLTDEDLLNLNSPNNLLRNLTVNDIALYIDNK